VAALLQGLGHWNLLRMACYYYNNCMTLFGYESLHNSPTPARPKQSACMSRCWERQDRRKG
jgi:hypothetical protein